MDSHCLALLHPIEFDTVNKEPKLQKLRQQDVKTKISTFINPFYTIQEKIKRALKIKKILSVQLEDNYQNHCVPVDCKFYKMRPRKEKVIYRVAEKYNSGNFWGLKMFS